MAADAQAELLEEGDNLLQTGQFGDAIEAYERARSRDPSDVAIMQRLGDAYRFAGRTEDSSKMYELAIEAAPDSAELWARYGDALIGSDKTEEAVAAFERAARLAPDEFTYLDWNIRGDRFSRLGDYETAARLYHRGLEATPNADGWRSLGFVRQIQMRYDDALEYYDAALELEPENAALLNDRGYVLRLMGRPAEALECFMHVVDQDPDSLEGWLNLGLAHRDQGRIGDAYEAYQRASELDPTRADTWVDLGLCEVELGAGGKPDEESRARALADFQRATEVDPSSLWGWNNAGWMLDELGRYDEALEALDRAIALDEREALPWRNKVWLHLQRGDVAAAEACADEMMEKASDSASALNVKASILTTWRGDDAQALVYLRQAFSTAPYDTSIASNLAEVLLNLASYEESRAIARTVLDLDLEDHIRCAMLFVTYASLVLEGAEAAARHEAFSQLVNFYRTTLFEGSSSASGWNYDALLRSIPKTAGGDTEAAFLLTTLIDIQARRFDGTSLSFFGARSGPE